jgi:hypothetical protein
LWIIGTVLIGTGMLHPSIVASDELREPPYYSIRGPRDFLARAPTPQPKKLSVDPNVAFAAKVKPGSFALVLGDGNRYIWTPGAEQKLPLETAFAKVELPLALVASLTFSDEQGAVKVTFRNGDSLTGKLLLKELAIRTAYGPSHKKCPIGIDAKWA